MKQLQISDRQSSFIFYLVHQGKGRTEAARLAGFAAPRQSAFYSDTITKNHRQNPARAKQSLPNRACVHGCSDS